VDAPITPASSSVVAPGPIRALRAEPTTRSWVVVSWLVSAITSRSPAFTSTEDGLYRMPCIITSTRTTRPVAATSAVEAAGTAPAAAGSTPTPTTTAVASAVNPAISWPAVKIVGRWSGSGAGGAGGTPSDSLRASSSLRAAMLAFSPSTISGRKLAAAPSASSEPVTFTQLGVGSSHSSRPPLIAINRNDPALLNHCWPARTTLGPPPSTDGSRYDSAPVSTWTPKPAPSTVAGQMKPSRTVAQSGAVASSQPAQPSPATSQSSATVTEAGPNSRGGLCRNGRHRPRPQSARPAR
jgi:hypothetical protein